MGASSFSVHLVEESSPAWVALVVLLQDALGPSSLLSTSHGHGPRLMYPAREIDLLIATMQIYCLYFKYFVVISYLTFYENH